jgi:hypothetical protein
VDAQEEVGRDAPLDSPPETAADAGSQWCAPTDLSCEAGPCRFCTWDEAVAHFVESGCRDGALTKCQASNIRETAYVPVEPSGVYAECRYAPDGGPLVEVTLQSGGSGCVVTSYGGLPSPFKCTEAYLPASCPTDAGND